MRQVADGIEFPNGMVVTPDNSTLIISESFAGRLTAFDIAADGSLSNRRVWAERRRAATASASTPRAPSGRPADARRCMRVARAARCCERIELERTCFACMLGGPDGTTLFMMAAEWRGVDGSARARARARY